jgi:hypothetical protein
MLTQLIHQTTRARECRIEYEYEYRDAEYEYEFSAECWRTMPSTWAAEIRLLEPLLNTGRQVTAGRSGEAPRAQSRSDGARNRNRNQG